MVKLCIVCMFFICIRALLAEDKARGGYDRAVYDGGAPPLKVWALTLMAEKCLVLLPYHLVLIMSLVPRERN
jgi:hypothetical protein